MRAVFSTVGIEVPEKLLSKLLNANKVDGTITKDIVKLFKSLKGVDISSGSIKLADIKSSVKNKDFVLVLWQSGETPELSGLDDDDWVNAWDDGHFSVVSAINDNYITFADPAKSKRTKLKIDDFKDRWHDIDGKKKTRQFAVTIRITDRKELVDSANKLFKQKKN